MATQKSGQTQGGVWLQQRGLAISRVLAHVQFLVGRWVIVWIGLLRITASAFGATASVSGPQEDHKRLVSWGPPVMFLGLQSP